MAASLLTGIKNIMQKEIFDATDEKLKSIISVTKPTGRSKKKTSYLALSGKIQFNKNLMLTMLLFAIMYSYVAHLARLGHFHILLVSCTA